MKTIIMALMLSFSLIALYPVAVVALEAGPENVVQDYYRASAEGDVEAVKTYITGPFNERRKVLLEKNKGYADFLRDHYAGIITEIVSVAVEDGAGKAEIVVKLTFQGGSSFNTTLLLKNVMGGFWKIYDERLAD